MSQAHLDNDMIEQITRRLRQIPPDARPRWGKMDRAAMVRHLVWAVRYAMGRSPELPPLHNWFTRNVVKPLILGGWMAMPRNVSLPRSYREMEIVLQEPGDEETLRALLEDYVGLVQADELVPRDHPFFGPMTVDDWDRLLVIHFEHHLRQFGA
ncbi:MAG TPA: DUF1569 domain-containing protein [Candidatus Hydrogenedentes bacterium]|nr:DUF1569 domain-containing protein [Candidatus Hydrogenedentota bacterium]HOJ67896.1 DUF1569 domain-containing protein [Candidatus Hydrogenedentota bacterium]HOK89535.1 DUF1569 domain-containing protein [Candidatus Hydrogenedentota bacterium]HPO31143.1 DUF1569 domain-containing protein [Candidatus Hydrogenedentota bacterium]